MKVYSNGVGLCSPGLCAESHLSWDRLAILPRMDDLKMFLALCLFVVCAIGLVSFGMYLGNSPAHPLTASRSSMQRGAPVNRTVASDPPENPKIEKSYELLPSGRVTITNSLFRDVEVRAEFPVTVIVGECQSNYTVQWHCSTSPHDVIVIDNRRIPLFRSPQANDVRITFKEF